MKSSCYHICWRISWNAGGRTPRCGSKIASLLGVSSDSLQWLIGALVVTDNSCSNRFHLMRTSQEWALVRIWISDLKVLQQCSFTSQMNRETVLPRLGADSWHLLRDAGSTQSCQWTMFYVSFGKSWNRLCSLMSVYVLSYPGDGIASSWAGHRWTEICPVQKEQSKFRSIYSCPAP